jgi:hypothetical protein
MEGPLPGPNPDRSGELPVAVQLKRVPATFEEGINPVNEPEHISEVVPEFKIAGAGLTMTGQITVLETQVPILAVML